MFSTIHSLMGSKILKISLELYLSLSIHSHSSLSSNTFSLYVKPMTMVKVIPNHKSLCIFTLLVTDLVVFLLKGGTFALYSLLCRHAKVKTIRNQHRTDEELTTYSRSTFHEHSFAAKTKRWLEDRTSRKTALLVLVLVGTCMVIGDGILTPAISGNAFSLTLSSKLCSGSGHSQVKHWPIAPKIFEENYIYRSPNL